MKHGGIYLEKNGVRFAEVQGYQATNDTWPLRKKDVWNLIIDKAYLTPDAILSGVDLDDMLDGFTLVVDKGDHGIVYSDCYAGGTCELERACADRIWANAFRREEY